MDRAAFAWMALLAASLPAVLHADETFRWFRFSDSEIAEKAGLSIANASTKFKQLWEQGFLMRNESVADSGGVEFLYQRIG